MSKTTIYRAAYWVADDRQSDVRLTSEEESGLPDAELIAAARAEAQHNRFDLSGGEIEIYVPEAA